MKKFLQIIYCALFLLPCAFFSLGMLIPGASDAAEGDVKMPALFKGDTIATINQDFGDELEDYFSKSFAYRNSIVDAFSSLKLSLFAQGNDQVIVGKDDFLFFNETLASYLASDPMTDDEINSAADSILCIYEYTKSHGADFIFVAAPNKNSIYPEMMPSRYIMNTDDRDLDRLYAALDERGVPYIDLRTVLTDAKSEQLVYHKRDTHWNTEGARIALEAIAAKVDLPLPDFNKFGPTTVSDTFRGDLDTLLFPSREMFDDNTEYDLSEQFIFTTAYSTPMDMIIKTRGAGEVKLLMFRDSFANALIPLMGASFEETMLERAVPYRVDLLASYDADLVIVEIAERNLRTLIGCDERIR